MNSDGSIVDFADYDYDGKCWWCGQEADSREHKFPRALLQMEFGKGGEWTASGGVAHVADGTQGLVNGPGSKRMTFQKVMCRKCNNERSFRYDQAVIAWASYVKEHELEILRCSQYSQTELWADWRTGRRDLTGFFVKHAACHLAQARIQVPQSAIDYLDGNSDFPPESFVFYLEIREDIAETLIESAARGLLGEGRDGALWIGDVTAEVSRSTGLVKSVHGHFTYRWLRLNWQYSVESEAGGVNYSQERVSLNRGRNISREEVEGILDQWQEET